MTISKKMTSLSTALLLLIFAPPVSYVVGGASSMSIGLLFASLLTIALLRVSPKKTILSGGERLMVLFVALLFAKGAVDVLVRPSSFTIIAYLGISTLVLAANIFASFLWKIEPAKLRKIFIGVASFLCFLLMISSFGRISIGNYGEYSQNVFPFSEPSHFAIFCGPLIAVGFFLAGWKTKLILSGMLWLGAFLLPNLTLAVLALLISAIYLCVITRRLALIIPILTLLALMAQMIDLVNFLPTHFLDRLNFADAENVSTLVYLQGWERSALSLETTNGLGVGFQNLESLESGQTGARLFDVLQAEKNLKDGGFLLSKLVGEFGIFGLGFCFAYLGLFCFALYDLLNHFKFYQFPDLRTGWNAKQQVEFLRAIGNIFIVVFVVEILVRGVGYFSLGVFFFSVGLSLRICTNSLQPKVAVVTRVSTNF